MLNKYSEQLTNIIETCRIHQKRLDFAFTRIELLFPVTQERFYSLTDDETAYIDQFIFRFAKYQDTIGSKLMKQILLIEGEDVEDSSFRDIFNRSEKIGLADNWEYWFELRQLRNEISHEYPGVSDEAVNSLNKMIQGLPYLKGIFSKCITFLKRGCLNY